MEKKNLPIKIFEKRKEIDERRTEGAGTKELPSWILSEEQLIVRAQEISSAVSMIADQFEKRNEIRKFIPAVAKVELNEMATAKSYRNDVRDIFNLQHQSNVIGFTNDNCLLIKINGVEETKQIAHKLENTQRHAKGISAINSVEQFKPVIGIEKESKEPLKVKLINFHEHRLNQAVGSSFEQLCRIGKVELKKVDYSSDLIVYRINNISADILNEIKSFEAIDEIEFMPKYSISLDDLSSTAEEIPVRYPQEGKGYPTIGILDSGIASIPHLKPWISDKSFSKVPADRINRMHGTFVSAITVYSDALMGQTDIGSDGCMLFDATVFPDTRKEHIEEWELIENIREAITKNSEIKIWNLSLGTRNEADTNEFSDFGIALDELQEKNNVLICKSAGNCENFVTGDPIARISKSADSVRSLVVGSVAHEKGKHDFADKFHPSPFSRIGKAPAYINKPDLTHFGGNAGVDSKGKKVFTGVKSFTDKGQIATNVGTSFSTPRVAALVAGIDHRLNENFNPLLLKGLTIHSAKYPDVLSIPHHEKIKYMGYGIPSSVDDTIYNSPNEVTLILQDTLQKGQWIEISDFPFPKSMVEDGFFYGQIITTLVASPVLNETQGGEYCQSNLEVRLGTYDTIKDRSGDTILNPKGLLNPMNILNGGLYNSQVRKNHVGDFARERVLIQYGDKYQPIKKYAIDLDEMTPANKANYLSASRKWYLHVAGLYRDFSVVRSEIDGFGLSQDFCLIITIRDIKKNVNVYDEVTQLLNQYGFIHSNINLKGEVRISVGGK